ncbi:hypothetical protein RB195_007815 [Necator americanus]|uniref:Ionotropic glutamate receptor C-terminal domain-containing protein n=1 Tax=Necator americanus TaxID=51031 RepID=A0ABR1C2F9_NECAM
MTTLRHRLEEGRGEKRGSPYRAEISRAILRLQEKTVLTELKEKWWKDKRVVCPAVVKKGTDDGGSIGGIFIILVIGLVVTIILVVLEVISRPDVVPDGQAPRPGIWHQLQHALCFIRSPTHSLKRKIDKLIVYEEGRPTYQYKNNYIGEGSESEASKVEPIPRPIDPEEEKRESSEENDSSCSPLSSQEEDSKEENFSQPSSTQ